jgi:hypothetical protein
VASNVTEMGLRNTSQTPAQLVEMCNSKVLSRETKINMLKLALQIERNHERTRCANLAKAIGLRKTTTAQESGGPREYVVGVEATAGDIAFEIEGGQ